MRQDHFDEAGRLRLDTPIENLCFANLNFRIEPDGMRVGVSIAVDEEKTAIYSYAVQTGLIPQQAEFITRILSLVAQNFVQAAGRAAANLDPAFMEGVRLMQEAAADFRQASQAFVLERLTGTDDIAEAGERLRLLAEALALEEESRSPDGATVAVDGADFVPKDPALRRLGSHWCHLFILEPDGDLEVLHRFAGSLGLKRSHFQNKPTLPHYDLNESKRRAAIARGAVVVDTMEFTRLRMRRSGRLRDTPSGNGSASDSFLSLPAWKGE